MPEPDNLVLFQFPELRAEMKADAKHQAPKSGSLGLR
jgi:hypothetical protein